MCDLLVPVHELKKLRFAISALAELAGAPGSFEREQARNCAMGIQTRIQWCVETLERTGEGNKNAGISMFREFPPKAGAG